MKTPPDPHTMPATLAGLTGQGVDAIDTPALVIDLDAMERNLARMAAFARTHGMRLRPHAKMHKSAALAALQMQAGAVGVCVQKTSEAEALATAGVTDLYISNEVIDPAKLQRVATLAQRLQPAAGWRLRSTAWRALPASQQLLRGGLPALRRPWSMSSSKSTWARAAAACRRAKRRLCWHKPSPPTTACALPACRPTTGVRSTSAAWTNGATPSPLPRRRCNAPAH